MPGQASDPSSAAEKDADQSPAPSGEGEGGRGVNKTGVNNTLPLPLPLPTNQPAEQLPSIGHIGRYALKYQIGEGGLGIVYAAHDPLLSRLIAIKTLHLTIAAEEREAFTSLFLNRSEGVV